MSPNGRLLLSIVRNAFGDDLERATAAFGGCTPEQLNSQYGQSGRTRGQILEEYKEHRKRMQDLLEYTRNLVAMEGSA